MKRLCVPVLAHRLLLPRCHDAARRPDLPLHAGRGRRGTPPVTRRLRPSSLPVPATIAGPGVVLGVVAVALYVIARTTGAGWDIVILSTLVAVLVVATIWPGLVLVRCPGTRRSATRRHGRTAAPGAHRPARPRPRPPGAHADRAEHLVPRRRPGPRHRHRRAPHARRVPRHRRRGASARARSASSGGAAGSAFRSAARSKSRRGRSPSGTSPVEDPIGRRRRDHVRAHPVRRSPAACASTSTVTRSGSSTGPRPRAPARSWSASSKVRNGPACWSSSTSGAGRPRRRGRRGRGVARRRAGHRGARGRDARGPRDRRARHRPSRTRPHPARGRTTPRPRGPRSSRAGPDAGRQRDPLRARRESGVTRRPEPVEDSAGFRAAVLVTLMVAGCAALHEGVGGPILWAVVLIGYPAAFAIAHATRHHRPPLLRVVVTLVAGVVLVMFLASIAGQPTNGFAALQVPLAEVFIWLMLLHAVDSPEPARAVHRVARQHRAALGRRRALDLDGRSRRSSRCGPSAPPLRSSLGQRAELAPLPALSGKPPVRSRALLSGATAVGASVLAVVVLGAGLFMIAPVAGTDRTLTFPAQLPRTQAVPVLGGLSNPSLGSSRPVPAGATRAGEPVGQSFGYIGFSNQLDTARAGPARRHARHARPGLGSGLLAGADLRHAGTVASGPRPRTRPIAIRDGQPLRIPRAPDDGSAVSIVDHRGAGPDVLRRAAGTEHDLRRRDSDAASTSRTGPCSSFPTGHCVPGCSSTRTASTPSSAAGGSRPLPDCAHPIPSAVPRQHPTAVRVTTRHQRRGRERWPRRSPPTAPTTYDKVLALERWMGAHTKYSLDIPPLPAGRGRGRPVPVRGPARLLRADRHEPGGDAALARHPGPAGRRVRHRRAQPVHRALRGAGQGRPRLGRGLLPRRRLAGLRPDGPGAAGRRLGDRGRRHRRVRLPELTDLRAGVGGAGARDARRRARPHLPRSVADPPRSPAAASASIRRGPRPGWSSSTGSASGVGEPARRARPRRSTPRRWRGSTRSSGPSCTPLPASSTRTCSPGDRSAPTTARPSMPRSTLSTSAGARRKGTTEPVLVRT